MEEPTKKPKSKPLAVVIFWCLILLSVGIAQRWMTYTSTAQSAIPVKLDQPLSTLPLNFGPWEGVDVPMDERILKVAGADDYVSRRYKNSQTGRFVDFYLAYTLRPANMLGHRPGVCYPAQGWAATEPKIDKVSLRDGKDLSCLIHHFTREQPYYEGIVVLNYYVLQGRHTTNWKDFWNPKWRGPNRSNDPNFYVAQVQIVTPVRIPLIYEPGEIIVKRFASEVSPLVDALLPLTTQLAITQVVVDELPE